jgi:predicted transcriptional regulator
MSHSEILKTSQLKLKILELLTDNPRTLSELSRNLNKTKSTLSFQIKPLIDLGLIRKVKMGGNTCYETTELGIIVRDRIVELLKLRDVLMNAGDFFRNHDLSPIPRNLLNEIHMLRGCRVLVKENPYELHHEWLDILNISAWVYGLTSVFHSDFPELFKNLAKDREVKIILTKDVFCKVKSEYKDQLLEFLKYGRLFICKNAKLTFIVAEKGITLNLYDLNGAYDPLKVLVCKTDEAVKWGLKLFDHYLAQSREVNEINID